MEYALIGCLKKQFRIVAVSLAGLLVPMSLVFASERYALLIGISEYQSPAIDRLEGPAHDLVTLKRTLLRDWQFDSDRVSTLLNHQATKANIMQSLNDVLERSNSGDYVLFYFSGHGTSAYDPEKLWPMPYDTGAVVPYDALMNAQRKVDRVISGRQDIRPVFKQLDDRGVNVLAILDTCYSEHGTRTLAQASYRGLSGEVPLVRSQAAKPATYPYQNIYMIAAAGADELALDLDYKVAHRYPTFDQVPHGALTDSLLRVITGNVAGDQDKDGTLTHQELFETTRQFMSARGYQQRPRAYPLIGADSGLSGQLPLFGSHLP